MKKKSTLRLPFIFLILTFITIFSLDSQSPFDLKRGKEKPKKENKIINPNTNPFDLVRYKELDENNNPQIAQQLRSREAMALPPITGSQKLFSLFILLSAATLIFGNISKFIFDNLKMVTNTNRLYNYVKNKQLLIPQGESILIIILFSLNITFFILFSKIIGVNRYLPNDFWWRFAIIFFIILLLIFIKYIINNMLAYIYEKKKVFEMYHQILILTILMITLTFTPLNLLLIYAPSPIASMVLYLMYIILSIGGLYFAIQNTLMSSNQITLQIFHFILYLCAFEIVPIALFTKYFL